MIWVGSEVPEARAQKHDQWRKSKMEPSSDIAGDDGAARGGGP